MVQTHFSFRRYEPPQVPRVILSTHIRTPLKFEVKLHKMEIEATRRKFYFIKKRLQ